MQKLHGAVITHDDDDVTTTTELLLFAVRKYTTYTVYSLADDLNVHDYFDFIILPDIKDARLLADCYCHRQKPLPVMIHIATPQTIKHTDYATHCPDIDIFPLEVANLNNPMDTLPYWLFEELLSHIGVAV